MSSPYPIVQWADNDSLHNTGDERAWWASPGILDPLQMASRLWAASRSKSGEAMRLSRMATVRGADRQDQPREPPW